MATVQTDEVRVRVTIDREMPDLFSRLSSSKRQAREVVHLLRLGLQLEMMLSGKIPMFAATPSAAVAVAGGLGHGDLPGREASGNTDSGSNRSATPTGSELSAMTGLTPAFFEGVPPSYQG